MTLVIVLSSFAALQHSCIIYCCLLGGMCVHFKFPGLARMLNLYCISVYSVIDPSGTLILGVGLLWACYLCLLYGSVTGFGDLWTNCFEVAFVFAFSVYFLPLTRPLLVILLVVLNSWIFGFKLGFHGHVGPCRICSLYSDILLVVYIYTYLYMGGCSVNFVVAGCCCLFLCLFGFCVLFCFRILDENEVNLLSPTTLT